MAAFLLIVNIEQHVDWLQLIKSFELKDAFVVAFEQKTLRYSQKITREKNGFIITTCNTFKIFLFHYSFKAAKKLNSRILSPLLVVKEMWREVPIVCTAVTANCTLNFRLTGSSNTTGNHQRPTWHEDKKGLLKWEHPDHFFHTAL